jgi:hypothetical protein
MFLSVTYAAPSIMGSDRLDVLVVIFKALCNLKGPL